MYFKLYKDKKSMPVCVERGFAIADPLYW